MKIRKRMETNKEDLRDRDDLRSAQEEDSSATAQNAAENPAMEASGLTDESHDEHKKHRHHEEHHINRKYKVYTNHASANDIPRTNTSF